MEKSIFTKRLFLTIFMLNFFVISLQADCSNRVFNINVVEKVSTFEVINQLSDACDFSVVIKDPIASKLIKKSQDGINIKNLTLEQIFEIMILDNDMYYSFENTILKIYALETRTFKIDYIVSTRSGSAKTVASTGEGSSDSNEISVEEKFDFWEKIAEQITAILNSDQEIHKAKKPIVNKNAGLVTVTATKSQLKRVKNYIDSMQSRLHKQVLIEVKIISVSLDNSYSTGIDWSKFGIGINQGSETLRNTDGIMTQYEPGKNVFASSMKAQGDYYKLAWNNAMSMSNVVNFSMKGLFNFLDEQGDSKVISSPKIITMNNQQALISVGSTINYQIASETTGSGDNAKTSITYKPQSTFIGILLNILPEISDDDKIMLRVNPSISSPKGDLESSEGKDRKIAPDTQEEKLSTVVRINDGETIILGGLITSNDGVKDKGIPILKNIPIFGRLFGSTTKTDINKELIFVITPRIIRGHYNHEATLRSMGYSKRIIVGE